MWKDCISDKLQMDLKFNSLMMEQNSWTKKKNKKDHKLYQYFQPNPLKLDLGLFSPLCSRDTIIKYIH